MNEGPPTIHEEVRERILTPEEVSFIFKRLLGPKWKEHTEARKLEDEEGLYVWDIKISGEDGDTEYSYMRKGRYKEGEATLTAVHVTFFDTEGVPIGGHSVAKYINGTWELTP